MSVLKLTIRTPEDTVFEGDVESLVVPGPRGYYGLLAHHAPMVGAVAVGILRVRQIGQGLSFFVVGEGVMEVGGDRVVAYVDTAYAVDDEADAEETLEVYLKDIARPLVSGPVST